MHARIQPVGHCPLRILVEAGEVPVNTVPGGIMAGHHGAAAWRTDSARYVKLHEPRTLGCQTIKAGRLQLRVAVTAQIPISPIIRKNKQYIGSAVYQIFTSSSNFFYVHACVSVSAMFHCAFSLTSVRSVGKTSLPFFP
jgi:hypothetical protein